MRCIEARPVVLAPMAMQLSQVVRILDSIAPPRYAESWDNVGLLVGEVHAKVERVLVTIDYTTAVAQEAIDLRADLVVAYHPPLFKAVKRLTGQPLIQQALRHGIALYSPHTALDVAPGGTNDVLANLLGLQEVQPLRTSPGGAGQHKLVFFVPRSAADKVCEAVFAAGAGRIGNYSHCSYRHPGTGSFQGEAGSKPVIGQVGQLEQVEELRIETVVPSSRVEPVVAALRQAHPYEEPAFDLLALVAPPPHPGIGRVGSLSGVSRQQLIERVKTTLKMPTLMVAGVLEGPAAKVAVCAGAGGELLEAARRHDADVFVTGELRHHDALAVAAARMLAVTTFHSNSERVALPAYAERLQAQGTGLEVRLSQSDRDPFSLQ